MQTEPRNNQTTAADMDLIRAWTQHLFVGHASIPCSFLLDGEKIKGIPAGWNPQVVQRRIDANLIETITVGKDPSSGVELRVEHWEYLDYPAVEWVIWLSNTGTATSGLIENLLGLDGRFAGEKPVLTHCNGDFYSAEGYTPQETALVEGEGLGFAPSGGRPSDGAFPYFRVQFAGQGLTLAVGWPGQWAARFKADGHDIKVTAGQEKTYLRLLPGERIRTPRMTLMAWQGETARGVNLWRRWYADHILPKPDGQPLRPKLACAATEGGEEFTNASEENQIRLMRKFKDAGFDFDIWWIDAGWYPCRDEKDAKIWWRTGTWDPDPARFPRGFGAVSKKARELGGDLLVWFEPERVYAGSQLDRDHPDWLLQTSPKAGSGPDMNRLLNLGNSSAREWLTDHVCQLIADGGIKVYRQDFNFPPLEYWRDNDAEDRQGMHENQHVQGYLRYWDDILSRNPGLWIDSCSSGGRRNDLETMRRAVPLHYTDYGYGDHAVKLAFHQTLYEWIPYFKECTLSWDVLQTGEEMRFDKQIDSFSFHCGMAAMLFATIDIRREDYDFELGQKMIAIWRRAAETLMGDYYPLTPFAKSREKWVAWQFDRPEIGSGFVQGIRLQDCEEEHLTVWLKGIRPEGTYLFENLETLEEFEFSGFELLQTGFVFKLPARCAAIWFYRMKDS